MRITERWSGAVVLAMLIAGTTACAAPQEEDGLRIVVSAPPLAYLAEQIAGGDAEVSNLTPPGADPHGSEISPAAVADLGAADLVVVVSGLQPAVDQAVAAVQHERVVDVLESATVDVPDAGPPPDAARDPHFWLDPVRFGLAAEQLSEALGAIDPENAVDYQTRAADLRHILDELDSDYRDRLAPCAGATLVTAHEAFGYLAARYELRQVGVSGIDPEVEPSPARLREVQQTVESTDVRTLFFETAADPSVAQTLAEDLGVATAVLDPMERSTDLDYLEVARTNLDVLVAGLAC